MALTYSPEIEIGQPMPHFKLPDVNGLEHDSQDLSAAPAKVIAFICGHCPYVQAIEDRLILLGKELQNHEVPLIGICANDSTEYPEDAPMALRLRVEEKGYTFPYLMDETQEVAKAFGAVCTPDFFVFDEKDQLAYRGRLDDSWKNPSLVTKQELYEAVLQILKKKKPAEPQNPSLGCSIKWKD